MASPRTRRVLHELKPKDENNVSFLVGFLRLDVMKETSIEFAQSNYPLNAEDFY